MLDAYGSTRNSSYNCEWNPLRRCEPQNRSCCSREKSRKRGNRKEDVKSENKAVITAGRHSCSVSLIRKNFVLL